MRESQLLLLQAYHDGEVGWLGRLRAERLLRRDAEARAHVEQLRGLGRALREQQQAVSAAEPDLWGAIRAGLDTAPAATRAPRPTGGETAWPGGGWLRWGAPLAAAAAGAAVALTLLLQPGDAAPGPSIRWLDSGGRSALVLQDDREATIIWVLDGPATPGGGRRGDMGRIDADIDPGGSRAIL